jgi:diguanylate cyclase (GGDEF)-like protein
MSEELSPEDDQASGPAGDARDRSAERRDQRAVVHDKESETRDEEGETRDQLSDARDEALVTFTAAAAADRTAALHDRRLAAEDRRQAADDREAAAKDRIMSAKERAVSSIDELTGAYRRDAGVLEMERETLRARRNARPLALAFVDLDGLKSTNDRFGHAAGDELLRRTVDTIRTQLRSYDLIVRFGGDEFVCVLLEVNLSEASRRFETIRAELAKNQGGSIKVGLAELRVEDSLEDLIARADDALYKGSSTKP